MIARADAAGPETLQAWDHAHLWHPFTPQADWADATPLIVDRAEGSYLYDVEGRRFLDGVGSLWCNVHGHRHPTIDAAIIEQLGKVAHSTLLGVSHAPAIELARRLVEITPEGLTRVFFSDDGATAVEVALKMVFQYWRQKVDPEPNRTRFVGLTNAYHGDTLGDVSIGDVAPFHAMFGPLLFPSLKAPAPYCYRCPVGLQRESCGTACLDELDKVLAAHPGEVAAVVIEPLVQGAAGIVVHPEGYLRGVRDLTRKHGTMLIADEVAVGFGKTGAMFACDRERVAPDVLCLSKGITGGYLPLAATLTTEAIYSAFYGRAGDGRTFHHGHTYGGNPLGAAAALASLRVFEEEQTIENLPPKVEQLRMGLAALAGYSHVGDVRQHGLIAGIELVADRSTRADYPAAEAVGTKVCLRARDFGVLLRPLGNVIVIMPPLSIAAAELDELLGAVGRSIRDVTEPEQAAS